MSRMQIEKLNKSFGKKEVLKDINLEFETGHVYGLFGANGSGKSTLLNIITQRIAPSSGKILIDDTNMKNRDKLLAKLYLAAPSIEYPEDFTVKTIINISAALYKSFDKKCALELIEQFGLKTKTKFKNLSTGEETILKDVLALSSNAEFIFLDEPELGVDEVSREKIRNLLIEKIAEEKSCFVIVSHLLEEIKNIIDRVVIISEGEIAIDLSIDEIAENYQAVSGKTSDVNAATEGKKIIGQENIGMFSRIIVAEPVENVSSNIMVEPASLVDIFKSIVGGKR